MESTRVPRVSVTVNVPLDAYVWERLSDDAVPPLVQLADVETDGVPSPQFIVYEGHGGKSKPTDTAKGLPPTFGVTVGDCSPVVVVFPPTVIVMALPTSGLLEAGLP